MVFLRLSCQKYFENNSRFNTQVCLPCSLVRPGLLPREETQTDYFKRYQFTLESADLILYRRWHAAIRILLKIKKKTEFDYLLKIQIFVPIPRLSGINVECLRIAQLKLNHSMFVTICSQTTTEIQLLINCALFEFRQTQHSSLNVSLTNHFILSLIFQNLTWLFSRTSHLPLVVGIGFYVIKKLPIINQLILLYIYNEMFVHGDFPGAWKNTFLLLIRKPDGQTLRLIFLTCRFDKLFETLVKNRLQWLAETSHWIPKSQHSFRRGNSCGDNLVGLTLCLPSTAWLILSNRVMMFMRLFQTLRGHLTMSVTFLYRN